MRSTGYKSFTARNIRFNLSVRTGATRLEHHAHHMYPQKFRSYFQTRGIKIDDPKNLRWWWSPSHLKMAAEYNARWASFIRRYPNATPAQVRQHGARLDAQYSRYYERPGPRGCDAQVCRGTMAA